ncbi:TonB-dependent siderophore receptor [Bordetella genomosp. 8]|uniref:TonB-dependent siderophore receptor n=1 Tax=Bordetella genomosp. 8 TaxID=1416806 RepID=A0A1W6YJP2_9BORD|nr:TonB-dependent siderophore receptor [Bordetella genomosp. 8]
MTRRGDAPSRYGKSWRHTARGWIVTASLVAGLGGLWPDLAGRAHAQPAPSGGNAAARPAIDTHPRLRFDIGPDRLARVVQAIASQAGVLLYFDPSLVGDAASDGLHGRYTLDQAFAAVLSDRGLEARQDRAGSYHIVRLPATDSAVLPTVQVQARPIVDNADSLVARETTTGTKTDTELLANPQSVSVITQRDMQARNAGSVVQALQYTPGVQINNYGGNEIRNDWIVLRGFDAKLTGDYRDGLSQMPYDQIRPRLPTYALESIEVLRGPSSSLYGQVSAGGLVNRTTKRPPDQPLREVAVELGSYDHRQAYLDLGGPIDAQDSSLYRLTATGREAGTQDEYSSGHRYRDNLAYVAPAYTWRSADTSFTLLLHYQHDRNDGESRSYYPWRTLVGDYAYDGYDRDVASAGYQFEHRFNRTWTARQNLRYQHGDMTLRNLYPLALQADGRTLSRYLVDASEAMHGVALDNQLEGHFDDGLGANHTLLLGIDFRRLEGWQTYKQGPAPDLDLDDPVYGLHLPVPGTLSTFLDVKQTSTQWGLYAQDQIRRGDWTLTLSGRHDRYDDQTVDRLEPARTTQRDNAFSGRAGLAYEIVPGVSPYVSYATSFMPQPGVDYAGTPFTPAKARQYEAGLKIQPSDADALYTIAIFDLRQHDSLTPDPLHDGFNVQAGEIRSRGLELQAKATLARTWDILAAYTYNDVTNLRSNDGGQGKTPIVTPRHMASLWLQHRFTEGPAQGWRAALGVRYVGTTWIDVQNTMKNAPATMLDASLGYETGAWRFSVDVTNLTNKETVVCRNDRLNCRYGIDRTVMATAAYRF